MKKIFSYPIALIQLMTTHLTYAQLTEGVIAYEVKINMHRRLGKKQEAMRNMVPEFRVMKYVLAFNARESLWKAVEEEEDDLDLENGGMRMRFRTPRYEIYHNQVEAKKITLQEFLDKQYLITDSIKVAPWKFTDETKTILGYPCKEARYTDAERNTTVVAWYTDKLRPGLGPENYLTLPGTVLEVDVNNGERVLKASKIDARPLKKGELAEPSKGQKMTEKQYQDLVNEQLKKRGTNGNIIIRN